jgi:hypothetical protein
VASLVLRSFNRPRRESWLIQNTILTFICMPHTTVSISQDYSGDDIDFTIDAGVLDSFINVQPRTSLCTMGSLTYISGATNVNNDINDIDDDATIEDKSMACLTPGSYQLYWIIDVPKGGGDAQLQYTPDLRIKFYSTSSNAILGCAGAGTMATVQQAELHMKEGEIALGVALTALFGIFAVCLCMAYRRKKQVELANQHEEDLWQGRRVPLARSASAVDVDPNESQEGGTYVLDECETESRQGYQGHSQHRYHHEQNQQHDSQDSYAGPQHDYYHEHEQHATTQYEDTGAKEPYSWSEPSQQEQQHPPERFSHPAGEYVHHDYDDDPSALTTSSIPYVVDISSLNGELPADYRYWNPPSPPTSNVPKSLRKKY